jgi:FdhE protein
MTWSYDARIQRAAQLAEDHPSATSLLRFYAEIADFQKRVFSDVQAKDKTDLRELVSYYPQLIELVFRSGMELLSTFAAQNLKGSDSQVELLSAMWEGGKALDSPARFFARVPLQPYAEYLASRDNVSSARADPTCPFCNAPPVAGVLRGEGDGGKRWLLCSLCSTEWQYRRVLCPGCGEADKEKLPIYTSAEFLAARVEACDTCHTYIKSIDLTKDGHAIPMVDEIATVALNIWAEEQDYLKLETNLLGL